MEWFCFCPNLISLQNSSPPLIPLKGGKNTPQFDFHYAVAPFCLYALTPLCLYAVVPLCPLTTEAFIDQQSYSEVGGEGGLYIP